jgi:hypothetical protein
MRNLHDAGAAHLDDADLLRLMDGEQAPDHKPGLAAHVIGCARCADAAATLQRDAATVRAWLELAAFETDFGDGSAAGAAMENAAADGAAAERVSAGDDAAAGAAAGERPAAVRAPRARPRPRSGRMPFPISPWLLRAAAIVLLVAAPVAAIPSLRGAILDALSGGGNGGPAAAPAAGPDVDAAVQPDVAGVRFEPAAGSFTVTIDAVQPRGSLYVLPAGGREALLHIGDPGTGAVVAPRSVVIRNASGSSGSYTLRVPAGVTSVTVIVAGNRLAVLSRDSIAAGAEVPLR